MKYSISFTRVAEKQLQKINDPFYTNIKDAILALTDDPRPRTCKKLVGRDGYRIRIGNYRVIYTIFDSELVIEIIAVGHRKDIYD
jgi:mRNA interferase RelE/StbE